MRNKSKKLRGFTLMDVTVGVSIFAIMLAIAVTMYTSATTAASTLHCHDNMEIIANLESEYKTNSSTHMYTATTSALNTLTPNLPLCPNGGVYTVTLSTGTATAQNGQTVPSGKIVISCSCSGHGKYAPDIDAP